MAHKPYAEIIVDLAAKKLDRIFHYRVPARLGGTLTAGMRVTIPFGRRVVEGYVVGFADRPDVPEAEVKDISEIVEHDPIVNEDLLALAGWMSERYLCSRVDALHAVMPASVRKAKPRFLQTAGLAISVSEAEQWCQANGAKAPKQAAVLRVLGQQGSMPVKELAALAGTTPAAVKGLAQKGLLVYQQTKVRRDPYQSRQFPDTVHMKLTNQQSQALKEINRAINKGIQQTFLLHGVTGSGKTEVYLQAIAQCLAGGRQAIVLVPEISLTPQMVERFKGRFGDLVAVLHSRLSAGERFDAWQEIKEGLVKVVVGARSAIFAPFDNLGLIVIDEEHETSYKQEESPKYHAREAAQARARLCRSVLVLGSATPSVETFSRAIAGRCQLLKLDGRVLDRPMPAVTLVDLREEMRAGHRSIFSRSLIDKMEATLNRREQVILFLNRRGYSTFVVCRDCGLVMKCPNCSITLTYHAGDSTLKCHYCGFSRVSPPNCPQCSSSSIRQFGVGTQRVEEEVHRWFPQARTARMDMDTTTGKGSHERILTDFRSGRKDVLIGTQMIAKGLDYPGVTLVGVITADTALNLPDFRSAERTFQLLTQVAGRAGRGEAPGEVVIQTYNPEHYSVVKATTHDYKGFFTDEIRLREALQYPPYSSMVRIVVSGLEENSVIRGAEILGYTLRSLAATHDMGVEQPLLGPAPASINKIKNRFRWQMCIRGRPGQLVRQLTVEGLKIIEKESQFGSLKVSVDVDPLGV